MTKKDYILIANAIKEAKQYAINTNPTDTMRVTEILATTLAIELKKENQAFDSKKFYQACSLI